MKKKLLPLLALLVVLYLGLNDGYLALYRDDRLLHTFPYRAELYPQLDQQALNAGIPIEEGSELYRLLEDYMS